MARIRAPWLLLAVACFADIAQAQARWTLTETLRIGGAETGPTSFLYTKAIEADSKGRIFVYDRKTQDIRVFAPDGKLVRVIGRLGSGPGEFRDAEGIAIARDGKLWVRDAANARFSRFSSEGDYEKSWTMVFCTSQGPWNPMMDRKGRMVDWDCAIEGGRARKYILLAYHTDMSRADTLADKPACGSPDLSASSTWITRNGRSTTYRSIPYAPGAPNAVGPDGEVWCAPNSSRYEVLRLRIGANDTTRIVRDVPPIPVTSAERDSVIATLESKGPSGLDFGRIPKVKPAIDRLTIDDQGRLWIRRTTAKGTLEYDIYGSDGRIMATAALGVNHSRLGQPFVVRGDNVYTVVLDEDDVQHVARFHIGR